MRQEQADFLNPPRDALLWLVIVMLLLPLLLTACGGGDEETAAGVEGQATLVCSAECAARGQCGESDQGQVVLLSRLQPTLELGSHDMGVPAGTNVAIQGSSTETAIELASGNEIAIEFYRVMVMERGEAGWVPAWCLQSAGQ